jgi:preprotein translocase subunit SecG
MIYLLTVIHVIVCVFLVIVVLLQSGKAADLAGAFGGLGSQTVFGPRGSATVLSKATTIAAALFMVTSLTLSIMATRAGKTGGTTTILDKAKKAPVKSSAPAAVPQPGQTVPITVTPEVGGQKQPTQVVPAPVIPDPKAQAKQKKQ